MSSLSVGTRRDGTRTVVALSGDLDLATVSSLRETALGELANPGCGILVLDLSELTFLDSTGLGCWIDLRNHAQELGKSIVFHALPPVARRTVTIAGLADLFGIGSGERSAT